jgi:hypothetical protein
MYDGMANHQFKWLWPDSGLIPSEQCKRKGTCQTAREALLLFLWRPVPQIIRALGVFNQSVVGTGLCRSCLSLAQTEYQKGQAAFWKELPMYFDLPAWEDLCEGPTVPHETEDEAQ